MNVNVDVYANTHVDVDVPCISISLTLGTCLYFDGRTGCDIFTSYHLSALVRCFGGVVLPMISRTRCSHVVAINLTRRKWKQEVSDMMQRCSHI